MAFAKPAFITQSLTEMDTLEISFLAANFFIDKIDGEVLATGTSISVPLPSQMSMAEFV